jgi:hypothetical protein
MLYWLSVSSRACATLDETVGSYWDLQPASFPVTPGFVYDAEILNFVQPCAIYVGIACCNIKKLCILPRSVFMSFV